MNKIIFSLLLLSSPAFAAGPVIWGPAKAQILPAQLCFADSTCQSTAAAGGASGAAGLIQFSDGSSGLSSSSSLYWDNSNKRLVAKGSGTLNPSPDGDLQVGNQLAAGGTDGAVTRVAIEPYGHSGGPWKIIARDTPAAAYLDFNYSNTEAITLSGNGNIGFGRSFPDNYPLEINGAVKLYDTIILPVQAGGSTPTCGGPQDGALSLTNGHILCVCNGSAWKKVSDGSTGCTF